MVTNFTPIDVQKFREKSKSFNTVLLLIATLTTFVLVILLFILIQKKTKAPIEIQPKMIITPTVKIMKPSPTPAIMIQTPTPETSPSGKIDINPTKSATESPTVSPKGTL